MSLTALDKAASYATCDILSNVGGGLVGAAVYPLWPAPYRLGALSLGSLSLLASRYLCPDMEVGGQDQNDRSGCQLTPNGGFPVKYQPETGEGGAGFSGEVWVEIVDIEKRPASAGPDFEEARLTALRTDGTVHIASPEWQVVQAGTTFGMRPAEGDECGGDPDGNIPVPPDAFNPINYTDVETNCTYTINLLGFGETYQGGPQVPIYNIQQATPGLRANGGRVGGCNFDPVIYMPGPTTGPGDGPGGGGGGGGGGPIVIPWDGGGGGGGGGGTPDWVQLLLNALAGGGGTIIANLILDALKQVYPGLIYRMVSVCEKDPDGEPISEAIEVPIPDLPAPDAQLARLDALVELLQASKNFKQPICESESPPIPEGDFRTVSFRSDETSPYGKSRLRKRFRYRSVSGNDLSALVDHWKDFSWEGGPYRVRWVGGSWRSPEIWAASEAEGQRVIQHAAAEAGVSPLKGGRWSTRLSSSGRQGVPGTMRVDTTGGYYWITARDGSDERPIVALT